MNSATASRWTGRARFCPEPTGVYLVFRRFAVCTFAADTVFDDLFYHRFPPLSNLAAIEPRTGGDGRVQLQAVQVPEAVSAQLRLIAFIFF